MRFRLNYRGYRFTDKDKICDALRTVLRDHEGLSDHQVHAVSGVAAATVHNWLDGPTRRPQNACVMAVTNVLGYARADVVDQKTGEIIPAFNKVRRAAFDYQKEREAQADWIVENDPRKKKRKRKKRKSNGHG
jgi:hypothetical protein